MKEHRLASSYGRHVCYGNSAVSLSGKIGKAIKKENEVFLKSHELVAEFVKTYFTDYCIFHNVHDGTVLQICVPAKRSQAYTEVCAGKGCAGIEILDCAKMSKVFFHYVSNDARHVEPKYTRCAKRFRYAETYLVKCSPEGEYEFEKLLGFDDWLDSDKAAAAFKVWSLLRQRKLCGNLFRAKVTLLNHYKTVIFAFCQEIDEGDKLLACDLSLGAIRVLNMADVVFEPAQSYSLVRTGFVCLQAESTMTGRYLYYRV